MGANGAKVCLDTTQKFSEAYFVFFGVFERIFRQKAVPVGKYLAWQIFKPPKMYSCLTKKMTHHVLDIFPEQYRPWCVWETKDTGQIFSAHEVLNFPRKVNFQLEKSAKSGFMPSFRPQNFSISTSVSDHACGA